MIIVTALDLHLAQIKLGLTKVKEISLTRLDAMELSAAIGWALSQEIWEVRYRDLGLPTITFCVEGGIELSLQVKDLDPDRQAALKLVLEDHTIPGVAKVPSFKTP